MEDLKVADIVRANKRNTKIFGAFMSERLVLPDGRLGETLRQFLAEERLQGRYPLQGNGPLYRPIKEGTVVVVPRTWGATTPAELAGALVGIEVIGTIPVAEDEPSAGEILVVRLTDPDGTVPADFVRSSPTIRTETDVPLGWDTWVDYPPGIPTAFPAEDPEPDDDNDDEGYW